VISLCHSFRESPFLKVVACDRTHPGHSVNPLLIIRLSPRQQTEEFPVILGVHSRVLQRFREPGSPSVIFFGSIWDTMTPAVRPVGCRGNSLICAVCLRRARNIGMVNQDKLLLSFSPGGFGHRHCFWCLLVLPCSACSCYSV